MRVLPASSRLLARCCLAMLASGCGHNLPWASSAPDSVTVRLWYKNASQSRGPTYDPEWGWDSLTVRVAAGDPIPPWDHRPWPPRSFRMGRLFRSDSTELIVDRGQFTPGKSPGWDSWPYFAQPPAGTFDTLALTRRLMDLHSPRGGSWRRIALVNEHEPPAPQGRDTCIVSGRVINVKTGRGGRWQTVAVLRTKLAAMTDTSGYFALHGVPAGGIQLMVRAAPGYRLVVDVKAPAESVLIRVDPAKFPHVEPAIPVPVPDAQ